LPVIFPGPVLFANLWFVIESSAKRNIILKIEKAPPLNARCFETSGAGLILLGSHFEGDQLVTVFAESSVLPVTFTA
jgi:hypothetical protein